MSRILKSVFIAAVLGAVVISPAWADRYAYRGGVHGGGYHGGGWGWWGPGLLFGTAVYLAASAPPPVYYPPPVYAPPVYIQPPVVIAQTQPPPAPIPEQNWWYYCAQAAGYYPYVKTCPTGWTRVSPTPPGQ